MAIQIFLAILWLSTPVVVVVLYIQNIQRQTRRILESIPSTAERFIDIRIWFKGFDFFKRKSFFQLEPYKIFYNYFTTVDLYVLHDRLFIVGKKSSSGNPFMSAFSIYWNEQLTPKEPNATTFMSASLDGDSLEIKFRDPVYTNNIKMVVKNIGYELYDKLKVQLSKVYHQ
jgi:hypothetical protein